MEQTACFTYLVLTKLSQTFQILSFKDIIEAFVLPCKGRAETPEFLGLFLAGWSEAVVVSGYGTGPIYVLMRVQRWVCQLVLLPLDRAS